MKLCMEGFLKKKQEEMGEISRFRDSRGDIGTISYVRRMVKGTKGVLAPLRIGLKMRR